MHKKRKSIHYDFPIYVGVSVLDISKTFLIDFLYNHVYKIFKDSVDLVYSDTDSCCLYIKGPHAKDPLEIVQQENAKGSDSWYDASVYRTEHPCFSPINCRVPGKMADEFPDDSIINVVGTGAKTYSILTLKGVKKRLKGIKKYVVDKEITHEDYLNSLLQNKTILPQAKYYSRKKKRNVYANNEEKVVGLV